MIKTRFVLLVTTVLLAIPSLALAGPGGSIVKAVATSFWGKLLIFVLFLFFLPIIAWVMFKERRAERRATKVLDRIAEVDPRFHPMKVKERMREVFIRVHSAWSIDQISEAAGYMTSWYWQNQEVAHLRRWEAEGHVNHCSVKSISSIRPLHVEAELVNGRVETATIVAYITANMQDYLAKRDTGEVVEGDKTFKDVDTVWTFTLVDGLLVVSQIEESFRTLTYAGQDNVVLGLPEGAARRA